MRQFAFLVASFVASTLSCAPAENGRSPESIPNAGSPSNTKGVPFDWPWCDVAVPPLSDCGEFGSPSDIGGRIRAEHVCTLSKALKQELSVRRRPAPSAVEVCHSVIARNGADPIVTDQLTYLRAKFLDGRPAIWIFLNERTGEIIIDPR
jgi:hypothetical protein